jgi:transcriptional regulator with XRE-family HTH domain
MVNRFTSPLSEGLVVNWDTANRKSLGLIAIGKAIRVVREARNQRLGEVAKNAGVSVPFLSLVENGEREPSLDVVVRLSMALKLPVDVLLLLTQSGKTTFKTSDRKPWDSSRRSRPSTRQRKGFVQNSTQWPR